MVNYRILFLLMLGLLTAACGLSQDKTYTVSDMLVGVKQPSVPLNGTWQFRCTSDSPWTAIQVPGEAAMQGYALEHDRPFRYRKSFRLPSDYRGKTVVLRFDGVYSHARLWVNGAFVREHHGGFTRWDTDVTALVNAGKTNTLELEITDRLDEISFGSGYAAHRIGGILRDVSIFALPTVHVHDLRLETQLDAQYCDALLRINYAVEGEGGEMVYTLTDPDGQPVALQQNRFALGGNPSGRHELPLAAPLKWDAEHPNLYTLSSTVYYNGKASCRFRHKVGFREVKLVGDRLLVNGQAVKLRGACRHDNHPTRGRSTTAEYDSLDAVLFKQANMNFVRTSHYPCSEAFLDYCDRLGLYVESETAVCAVDTHRKDIYLSGATQNDPAYADRYLSQCQEMVRAFYSHPSVLFWSLGNESSYGENFRICHEWLVAADSSRPVIFSYPGTQKEGKRIYDILSVHYPDVNGGAHNFGKFGIGGFRSKDSIPVLFDEWMHVACYTYSTLRNDPNIREFWGKSLDRIWENIFEVQGGLGGAIWGYIDETFMLPAAKVGKIPRSQIDGYSGNGVGAGEWGIVDVWRRPKPEFWSTKKAYSPVRLPLTQVSAFSSGDALLLPVHNRFDHTNLNEIVGRYIYKGIEKPLPPLSLAPHRRGILTIPAEDWQNGEQIFIAFHNRNGELIDAYNLTLGRERTIYPPSAKETAPLQIEDKEDFITVKGIDFEIPFNKTTGLVSRATSHGAEVITSAPFLHIDMEKKINFSETDWHKTGFTHKQHKEHVEVSLSGTFKEIKVDYLIRIFPDGQMQINYVAFGEPAGYLRETGLKFYLSDSVTQLEWKRKGYWSYYPEDSFAGHEGSVAIYKSRQSAYGERPVQPWHYDTHNYYYFGDTGVDCAKPLTQQAKGMKEYCHRYALSSDSGKTLLSVYSADASLACRLHKTGEEKLVLYANNRWDYPEIGWGNEARWIEASPCAGRVSVYLGR